MYRIEILVILADEMFRKKEPTIILKLVKFSIEFSFNYYSPGDNLCISFENRPKMVLLYI